MCALLYMQMTAYSLKGHLECNGSLVFYCCPSAELTAMDGVVTAMCRALGCQCLCVWCTNWDPQVHASSCATAEDIVLEFSACFHWNLLHALLNDAYRFSWCLYLVLMPKMCLSCAVSEDELNREADDMGVTMEDYVDELLHALTGGGGQGVQRRHNQEEAVYLFQLTPDHCRLSYQKISNNVLVSQKLFRA